MANVYFAFDTETGGLTPEQDILSIYAAMLDENLQILEELDLKLKPNDRRVINAEVGALKVNKIDIAKHMADPATIDYATAGKLLIDMAKRHLKKNGRFSNIRPYGYNVPCDKDFVTAYLITPKEWTSIFHYKSRDVMTGVDFLKDRGWFPKEIGSLGTVVEFLGLPVRAAHIAKNDILMTIDVDKKLDEIMASRKDGGSGGTDLISLLEAE